MGCEERRGICCAWAACRERSEVRKIEDGKRIQYLVQMVQKECRPVTAPAAEIDAGSGDEMEEWRWKRRAEWRGWAVPGFAYSRTSWCLVQSGTPPPGGTYRPPQRWPLESLAPSRGSDAITGRLARLGDFAPHFHSLACQLTNVCLVGDGQRKTSNRRVQHWRRSATSSGLTCAQKPGHTGSSQIYIEPLPFAYQPYL